MHAAHCLRTHYATTLVFLLATAAGEHLHAQGPSSRPSISGGTAARRDSYGNVYAEDIEVPIPDLFRTEAPFVERNLRLDYLFTNDLQEPPADESQFFAELSYSFSNQLGVIIATPYLIRDHEDGSDESGFGDLEAGLRYVAIGPDEEAPFKMALGFNVVAPTGDEERELGEGVTFLEPEVLFFEKIDRATFAVYQFSLGVPTESGSTTEFEYNVGVGHVFTDFQHRYWFSYPTATFEVNGFTGVGGVDAGTTIVDLTPGLRWTVGRKWFAGVATSVPITGPREFESQFIFSLIYRYGVEPADSANGSNYATSRPSI